MVWRALYELTPARLKRIQTARARVRRHVWSVLPDGLPTSKVADTELGEVVVLDSVARLYVDVFLPVTRMSMICRPTVGGRCPAQAWCSPAKGKPRLPIAHGRHPAHTRLRFAPRPAK